MSIQVVSIGGVSLLQDLLSEDNVSFRYPAETWEDVIRHGGQLMVDACFTEPTYTEAMIDVVSVALFLCAPNKDEHIQLLTDIATLFEDEEFLDAAVNFESIEDVQSFLAEHLDEA